ncbi:MAG: cytochrome c [Myxococcaceae bacterium]|nr:cytochrome c [Myxococcaceae bacterium]
MRPALPLLLFAACSAPPGVVLPVDRVVRPTTVTEGQLPTLRVTLPAASSRTHVAVEAQRALVASEAGLFELNASGTLETQSTTAVQGLLSTGAGVVLVARADGLFEWSPGGLRRSELAIATMNVDRLLTRAGSTLWLGRPAELIRFDGSTLATLTTPGDVTALHARGDRLAANGPAGHWLVEPEADGYRVQQLDDELALGLTALVPFAENQALGLDAEGRLWKRLQVENGTAWRRVALTSDASDPGAGGLTALGIDADTGAAWLTSATTLYRLQGGDVLVQPLDSAPERLQVEGGTVWLRSGTTLTRVGRPDPVRFEPRVRALADAHCVRCHAAGLQGVFPLKTADEWRMRVDAIVTATSNGRMPADTLSALSEEDRTLIRQWREDGLK